MKPKLLRAASAASALALSAAAAAPALAADPAHPFLVELFQSQGCSDCPPVNTRVMALSDRPDVLALSFQVTYWDKLGWRDTFDSPAYTARQWDYAHAFHHAEVFTPQVVVNGRGDVVGAKDGEIEALMARTDRGVGGPALRIQGDRVVAGAFGVKAPADVWAAVYDPRILQVPIAAGENAGRTLPHKNVVRRLVRLGRFSGASASFRLPAHDPALRTAVWIQAGPGGAVLAAARG